MKKDAALSGKEKQMYGAIIKWLKLVFGAWNIVIRDTFNVLMKLPGNIGMSAILDDVNAIFVGVGTSLVVLFFVIGFCQETVNVREEMRYESIVRYLIRLCMAEYFTINSKTVLMSILKCCRNFVKLLKSNYGNQGKASKAKLEITNADRKILKELGSYKIWDEEFLPSMVELMIILFVSFVVGILIVVMAAMIWYMAWSRMLNLLILIPFGSLAFSTMGGAGEVGRTCSTYLKKFIAVALENVAIAAALIFGTALMKYAELDFAGSGWTAVIGHLLAMLLQAGILTGTVKGAEYIMKDMIGVY